MTDKKPPTQEDAEQLLADLTAGLTIETVAAARQHWLDAGAAAELQRWRETIEDRIRTYTAILTDTGDDGEDDSACDQRIAELVSLADELGLELADDLDLE